MKNKSIVTVVLPRKFTAEIRQRKVTPPSSLPLAPHMASHLWAGLVGIPSRSAQDYPGVQEEGWCGLMLNLVSFVLSGAVEMLNVGSGISVASSSHGLGTFSSLG